jgi:hypothetical protein
MKMCSYLACVIRQNCLNLSDVPSALKIYVPFFTFFMISNGSRNIVVGTVNRYEQYGPAFDSRPGQEILSSPKCQKPALRPTKRSIQRSPWNLPGCKVAGA